jgi:hypothetical protein
MKTMADGYDVRMATCSSFRPGAYGAQSELAIANLRAREAPRGIPRSGRRRGRAGQPAEGGNAAMTIVGSHTTYRRHNKPALGPVGDSLDDLEPPFSAG